MQIDLGLLTDAGKVHNLSGKERGEQARKKFGLDTVDESQEDVVVVVPDTVYSLSTSFFLGLFSPTVEAIGDDGFRRKYKFSATPLILQQVDYGLERCVSERGPLQ